jgi:hypothetical protein
VQGACSFPNSNQGSYLCPGGHRSSGALSQVLILQTDSKITGIEREGIERFPQYRLYLKVVFLQEVSGGGRKALSHSSFHSGLL